MADKPLNLTEYIPYLKTAYDKVLEYFVNETEIKELNQQEHFTKLLKENVFGGKMFRGCTVLYVIDLLSAQQNEKPDFELGSVVGISLEIIHASFLIADDIIDQSSLRRGKPCWYKKEDV